MEKSEDEEQEVAETYSTIRVKLLAAVMKPVLEILSAIADTACFTFTARGFSIHSATQAKKKQAKVSSKAAAKATKIPTQVTYKFYGNKIARYKYDLKYTDGKDRPEWSNTITVSRFLNKIKSLKKDFLSFKITVASDGSASEMRICVPSGGCKILKLKDDDDQTGYVDHLNKWFKDKDPTCKVAASVFLSTVASSKHNNCTEIELSYNTRTKRTKICCWDGDSLTPEQAEPLDNAGSDSSFEADEEDDKLLSRSIITTGNPWIIKLPKLDSDSVIQCYIAKSHRAPLIMSTPLSGSQGEAIFVIPNLDKR